jgi:mono/diheme cytochrome c family protein
MTLSKVILLLYTAALLISCGRSPQVAVDARDLDPFADGALCGWETADPVAGRALFEQQVIAGGAGCITCHSLAPDVTLVGPSLYGIATTAFKRVIGVETSNYIYLSITEPNQHVVEGFPADTMPGNYAADLTADEIANLVSFLMTLEREE